MFDISIKMAESGCLRSESMNTMDVATKIVTGSLDGNQLTHTHVAATDERESPAQEGEYIEKNVTSGFLPALDDNVVISIPWPENTYIKTVALMIIDGADDGAATLIANNSAAAFWVRLDADNHAGANANIMPFKRLVFNNDAGDSEDATLFKDSPITIIKNFTGIRAEFADQVPGIKFDEVENNDAFQILDAWDGVGRAWTNGTTNSYPLYNPSDTHKRTNFEITFKKAESGISDSATGINFGDATKGGHADAAKLKVMAICTFLKMDLTDFGF